MTLGLSNGPKHAARRAKEARVAAIADFFPETKPDVSPDEAYDERYSTRETVEWCKARAGVDAFDLDVAACEESHWAPRWYSKAEDGLRRPWFGRVWCNPPYSDIEPWLEKAWAEWNERPSIYCIAMLIPATRTEQPFWQKHVEPFRDDNYPVQEFTTHFMAGRTAFARPGSGGVGQSGGPFGCVLCVWRREPMKKKLRVTDCRGCAECSGGAT